MPPQSEWRALKPIGPKGRCRLNPNGVLQRSIFYYSFIYCIIAIIINEKKEYFTNMRARTTLSEIDAQIERLREKRRLLLAKANERFARAAAKAGLAELEIPDADLDDIFEEIAARYRTGGKGPSGASA
jgi:hypothetical protein